MPDLPAYDVIVIGGSFAGLSAALQLGRARRSVLVIDAGENRNRFAHAANGLLGHDGKSPAEILEAFLDIDSLRLDRAVVPLFDESDETCVGYTFRSLKPYCGDCSVTTASHRPKSSKRRGGNSASTRQFS